MKNILTAIFIFTALVFGLSHQGGIAKSPKKCKSEMNKCIKKNTKTCKIRYKKLKKDNTSMLENYKNLEENAQKAINSLKHALRMNSRKATIVRRRIARDRAVEKRDSYKKKHVDRYNYNKKRLLDSCDRYHYLCKGEWYQKCLKK